ncbi:MAG: hypothetical protein ACRDOE_00525 [Streptosporangiaceae bacterium]
MTPDDLTGDEAAELLTLDPDVSTVVFACGRKGTGKSVLTTSLFREYPYDRLLIDPTGDVDPFHEFTSPASSTPPETWPDTETGERASLRVRPNRRDALRVRDGPHKGLPQWKADVDQWIGLAMDHGRTAIELDDCGEVIAVGRVPPYADDMLHTLRHRHVPLFMSCPRPVGIDPLGISQADLVAIFDVPHELDIRRLALNLGLEIDELYGLVRQLDEHEFLLFVAKRRELFHCDPLPV